MRVIADLTSPEDQWRRLGDWYRVEASFNSLGERVGVAGPGERVITHPDDAVEDGERVEPRS